MTKRRFSFAKLHKDGQEVSLCDDWTAHFRTVIEPRRFPPYLTVLLVAQVLYAGKVRATLRIKDAVNSHFILPMNEAAILTGGRVDFA
jgi:hypothetical protein